VAELLQDIVQELVVVPLRGEGDPDLQQLRVLRLPRLEEGLFAGQLALKVKLSEEVSNRAQERAGALEGEHLVEHQVIRDGVGEQRAALRVPQQQGAGVEGRRAQRFRVGGNELRVNEPRHKVVRARRVGEGLHALDGQTLLLANGGGQFRDLLGNLQDELGHRDSFIAYSS
jgi:hypothetical protein